jgi:hypothetical protein
LGVLKPAILETDVHLSQLPQSLPEIINQHSVPPVLEITARSKPH